MIASYDCLFDSTASGICDGLSVSHTPTILYIETGKDARSAPKFDVLAGAFTAERFADWLSEVHTAA